MANSAHSTTTSRRLFLAAGSAAAVFGSLNASAAEGLLKIEEAPYGDLVSACRSAIEARQQYDAAVIRDEDYPGLDDYHQAEVEGIRVASRTPAKRLRDIKAKAELLRLQLPTNPAGNALWAGSDMRCQLTWSLISDVLALRA